MALRCEISRLDTTNLLNFCYIQKFSKPFLFTSQRNILNPKLELIIVEVVGIVAELTGADEDTLMRQLIENNKRLEALQAYAQTA